MAVVAKAFDLTTNRKSPNPKTDVILILSFAHFFYEIIINGRGVGPNEISEKLNS
jgi:hypothetical protein